jgi:capsular polysaccharide export protein
MPQPAPTVLFLMGPSSPLWRELGYAFEAKGCRVVKVCFAMGDWLYWRRSAYHYRGRLSRWQAYLQNLIAREGITTILYYADRQPYHAVAAEVARASGVQAISLENGYLRPDWLTLERGGMGAHSHFPADPARISHIASAVPEPDLGVRYPHGFWTEMVHEVTYHLLNYSWRIFYPFYCSGKYYDTLLEVLLGIRGLFGRSASRAAAQRLVAERLAGDAPFYVLVLQLQGDYQIRANSPYTHIRQMIDEVVASFAHHAPQEARLVVKQHPHDNNRENWARQTREAATQAGIAQRVDFIDGGDLGALLDRAAGCVMINSTVGLFALRHTCPTKTLGIAIYDVPGLTHQGSLDSFWTTPDPVDPTLMQDFVRAMAGTIQVKGSFYHPEGRRAAIEAIVARVHTGSVNAPDAFEAVPPRLEKAREMGILA